MAKPKIPNQKKKYNELNKRLSKYVLLVEQIYDALNLEASKIALRTEYDSNPDLPFKFSDYPQTNKSIDDLQVQFVNDLRAVIYRGTSDEWKNSNHVQDLMANNALKAYSAKIDKEKYKVLYQTNSGALKAFQNRKDKGFNVSAKLWQQSAIYNEEMEAAISCAIQKGTSAVTLSKQISKYLIDFPSLQKDYKEKYGSAEHLKDCEYRSIRLARSEINMAYRTAEQERWRQMDFIVGYEVKRSGRDFPCTVCESLVGKYPKSFKFTSWHPSCRCYCVPILKTEEEFWSWDGRSDVNTSSMNEVKDVPNGFKQWVSDNQNRISDAKKNGTLPYFLKDNQSYIKEDKEKYIQAVTKYTGSYYPRINQYLRGQRKQLDNESLSVVEDVSKYIGLSDKYVGASYRGIVADRKVFDTFMSSKKGDTFTEKGFMSTSANKLVAEDFADGTQYKIIFEVKGKNGVDISHVSDIEEEKEILFDKSSKFKILKITKKDKRDYGNIHIYMEEI